MRKLILKMSMSTNGFVAGPHGELDWMFGGDQAGSKAWQLARAWDTSLHIMGRKTFNDMKSYWPTSKEAYAAPMNSIPKAYFSRSALSGSKSEERRKAIHSAGASEGDVESWDAAPCLTGDLATQIGKLKEQDGKPIIAWGGAGFARGLIPSGLIDEYQFLVHPVVLPAGLEIFSTLAAPLKLKLVAFERFDSGVLAKTFEPA